jgi:YidC/Oxa1 family membrane protein insertase
MEKRAFLAVFLSVLVFILYQYYYISRFEPSKIIPEDEKKVEKAEKPAESPVIRDIAPTAEETSKIRETTVKEREIKIDTGVTEVILTNRGGKVKAINLLKYKTKGGAPVNLVKDAEGKLLPVKLEFTDKNFSDAINSTLFDIAETEDAITLSPNRRNASIGFSYRDDSGFEIYKEYTFYHEEYKVDVSIRTGGGAASAGGFSYQALWGPGLMSEGGSDGYSYEGPTSYIGRELVYDKLKGKGEQIYHEGNIKWVAIQNKYFMAALIPLEAKGLKAISKTSGTGDVSVGLEYISAAGRAENRVILYAGPKESEILKSYNVSLEEIINYGWFDFLAKPLFKVLKLFYSFTHNYGIAIIILTVIIKLIFYPLSQKSLKSMQKLQKLQPELKIIQERYKNDRQKMSAELMRLYRENKVNPFGGFFLIIIQIPVFIALYKVLMETIELRQSPFFGWIKDLSDKDPYYITPIIMGATMFIQQKMTPSAGDPMQAKIMLIMPIIFTFMFLNFPSGLVLYWLVNNILSIAQQYLIYKDMKK